MGRNSGEMINSGGFEKQLSKYQVGSGINRAGAEEIQCGYINGIL